MGSDRRQWRRHITLRLRTQTTSARHELPKTQGTILQAVSVYGIYTGDREPKGRVQRVTNPASEGIGIEPFLEDEGRTEMARIETHKDRLNGITTRTPNRGKRIEYLLEAIADLLVDILEELR